MKLTKTEPKKWTDADIKELLRLKGLGYSSGQIGINLKRSQVSIQIKAKRLQKAQGTGNYNAPHVSEKYTTNEMFGELIQPKTVLDLYAGEYNFWKKLNKYDVVSNDIKDFSTDYQMDAEKLLMKFFLENRKFDLIDLDPFGSSFDCFGLAVRLAKKGLIITFGEMGHKRWKRLDFVSKRYGINSLEDFSVNKMIEKVVMIGRRYKKTLKPIYIKNWRNIARVYFQISTYKEYSQWEK